MLAQKQKNFISYELYSSRKSRQPDYLCNVIKKYRHIQKVQSTETDPLYDQEVKKMLNEKRIQEIKKMYKNKTVSQPESFIKRTWISPLEANQKKQEISYCVWKKPNSHQYQEQHPDIEQTRKVLNILNMNKKMHLFGEYMFCEFQDREKENFRGSNRGKTDKKMDAMHKQYCKLMNSVKKSIVICNKGSDMNKKIFCNPLQGDKFYQKIIRYKDEQLVRLLIETLSMSGNFTFSSFILFYELFVWQQAAKQNQIDFVLKILMGTASEINFEKLSSMIDLMCSKINLVQHKQSLSGFNEVMKKLIFGSHYENCQNANFYMNRKNLYESLEINEECISIFINVFYSE